MRDLGSLRELKPHKEELLKKPVEGTETDEDILSLMTKHKEQRTEPKRHGAGRPHKQPNQVLNTRIACIFTKEQKQS